MQKDEILPAKRWSVLTETVRLDKMCSRNNANFSFLSIGKMKAPNSELTKTPRNLTKREGIRVDLESPRKYPNETRTAAHIKTAASASSRSDQSQGTTRDLRETERCPT